MRPFGDFAALQISKLTQMNRDNELRERRDKAIFARFNELIVTGKQYQILYEQIGDEFYLSDATIKQIVLRAMHTHDRKKN